MYKSKTLIDIAQALADPLRLVVLQRLMDGPATVSELQALAGQSQSKVSNHLAILRERGLVRALRKGRQMIYGLSDVSVAQLVESLTAVAGAVPDKLLKSPELIGARTCYDHLAGRLGVALFDALLSEQAIGEPAKTRAKIELGPRGAEIFGGVGIDLEALRRQRRRFAFACPDWTEHRPHLGGVLGAALCSMCEEHGWVVKQQGTRAVVVTDVGRQQLKEHFGVILKD